MSPSPLSPGDGNFDGVIDGYDYLIWAGHYGDDPAESLPGSPSNGDYNNDGVVDGDDYNVWADHYGQGPGDVAAIPEPGAFALLIMGAAMLFARRRV
jgi:hypothetical protein